MVLPSQIGERSCADLQAGSVLATSLRVQKKSAFSVPSVGRQLQTRPRQQIDFEFENDTVQKLITFSCDPSGHCSR